MSIPEAERASSVKSLHLHGLPLERALGIQWDVGRDDLTFSITQRVKPATRRGYFQSLAHCLIR